MKSFYKKILIFLLPCIIVWIGTEVFYRSVETNYTFKHRTIVENYNRLEVLALGNSHSLYGINPIYFDRPTFNAANISQSLYFDELILEQHLERLTELKAVILTVSYFSLSQKDNTSEDRWRKYFYKEQMNLEVPIVSKFDIKNYSLSLARRFDKSLTLFHEYINEGTILACDENGYGLQDESDIVANKDQIASIIAKKHEDNSLDFRTGNTHLKNIISLCEERGIQVFLVEMPVYKNYYKLLNSEKVKKISATCNTLAEKHSHVHHIRLSQDSSFEDSDLRDADHLTTEGAKKCSKLLNEIIEESLNL